MFTFWMARGGWSSAGVPDKGARLDGKGLEVQPAAARLPEKISKLKLEDQSGSKAEKALLL